MRTVDEVTDERGRVLIPGPAPARFMFQHTQASWLWLFVRLWVGWQWLENGWRKVNNPAWMDGSGSAILGFWERALGTTPDGKPVITFDWYRGFIQFLVDSHAEGWFSKVIVFGELAVGLGLILGAFTGLAAAGGLLMSESYMLAGTASTSPLLALLEILLIFAWKTAGYIGLDRWLLPSLIPWWEPRQAGTCIEAIRCPTGGQTAGARARRDKAQHPSPGRPRDRDGFVTPDPFPQSGYRCNLAMSDEAGPHGAAK
jgi:thiosulfate dehydrogenase [quinone] large subunit